MPDTEYDNAGKIIGQGLTLTPTRHHLEIGGIPLYTWCALDTLIFPAILDTSARIESTCQACGVPIRATVNRNEVTNVEPVSAVVSLVTPDDMSSIRSAFCNQVHFFASSEAAQPWLDAHPGGTIIPVTEAYQLGTSMAEALNRNIPGRRNRTRSGTHSEGGGDPLEQPTGAMVVRLGRLPTPH